MPYNTKKRILIEIIAALIIVFLMLLVWVNSIDAASKQRDVVQGNAFYQQGDYATSVEKYTEALEKDPESDTIHFNMGTALYKKKDYEKAIKSLQKVLLSDNKDLKENAYYNLGNTLYKYGVRHENQDIALAISSLEKSLSQYERALSIASDDQDAQFNYEYVKKELERLKQQQHQQQQKQEDQQHSQKQNGQKGEDEQQRQQQSSPEQEKQQAQSDQGQSQHPDESSEQEQQDQQQDSSQQEAVQQQKEQASRRASASADVQELTKQEAQMILDNYTQTEEPQGLFNALQKTGDMRPPAKDW